MQIVVQSPEGEREIDVDIRNPDATVADLVRSTSVTVVPDEVGIGERVVPASCTLTDAGLYEGAQVSTMGPSAPPRPPSSGFEVAVVAGLDAGRSFPLPIGSSIVGRERSAALRIVHPTVSRKHCAIEVRPGGAITVTDLVSVNATVVDGCVIDPDKPVEVELGSVIQLGAVALEIRVPRNDDRPQALDLRRQVRLGGTLPFNRPPRRARPGQLPPVKVPKPPGESSKTPFSTASIVGPLVLAVVMIAVTKDIRFALFSILSPFMAVGSWYESRRRSIRKSGSDQRRYREQLTELRAAIDEVAIMERARLRELSPHPAEVLRRAGLPSVRLWERRGHDDDFLCLFAGIADIDWRPPVKDSHDEPAADARELLDSRLLQASPVTVDLSDGGVVGIVGDRDASLAVARSLVCQAATHHGPADLTIGVFVDPGRDRDWEWCKWLPHARNRRAGSGARWLAARPEDSDALLRSLAAGAANGTVLVILDSDVLTEGTDAPARTMLQPRPDRGRSFEREEAVPVAGIVIASSVDRLPWACNTIIELVGDEGDATVLRPQQAESVGDVLVAGLSTESARRCARDLARFDDPDLIVAGAGLPDGARLLPLLQLDRIDSDSIRKRWRQSGSAPALETPLGVTEQGLFVLNMVRDGPHGLVAGTTGSGKSELLRTLVAGLAAHTDPTYLTFVLVDYKGGAAFAECSRLPHTVGMVTDLDEQLGERALRALEAELHHRERVLRRAGADNLKDYLARGGPEPLPRLIVVIDEFATMAAELPDFISSLVGIAQRGRTLGVHMILATQRPSGAVNDNIKANTNLRIALRVQDGADSVDVIGSKDAADLSRSRPGRAYVRLGPDEIIPIQAALVTCVTDEGDDAPVEVAPFRFGPTVREPVAGGGEEAAAARSDLTRLVDAIVEANEAEGIPLPRRPWPEPLPPRLDLAELMAAGEGEPATTAMAALADDPGRQAQYPVGWDLTQGNLLLFGIPGSGTTSTLVSLALSLASKLSPDQLELYALDFGVGELATLERLPHTGSVILAGDRERQTRLVRHLRAELESRRVRRNDEVRTVVLIDNFSAMRSEFDDVEGLEVMEELTRVFADGPEVGISFAIAADRVNAVPGNLASLTTQKWLFRLADVSDYSFVGLNKKHVPHATPGRAVMVTTKQQIQLGLPSPSVGDAASAVAGRYRKGQRRGRKEARRAAPIGVLPERVSLDDLGEKAKLDEEPWLIPIGIRESDLAVARLALYEGEHAAVAGPARSGKSMTLWAIGETVKGADPAPKVFGVGGRRSPLRNCPALDRFAGSQGEANALVAQARTASEAVVVLIDDAGGFDDLDGTIEGLVSAALPNVHVVAAANADTFRSLYGHWTKTVRLSKVGVLLRPNIDLDGDLLGVGLPRRAPVPMVVGRGYVVQNGEYDIVQVATVGVS